MSIITPAPDNQSRPDWPDREDSEGDIAEGLGDLDEVAMGSLDRLSRALRVREGDLDGTLVAILESAVRLVDGANAAGLNLFVKGKFVPQVVLGAAPPVLDALQQRIGTGPCVDASREQRTIEVIDMTLDERWPVFSTKAVALDVRSMLCVPLWIDDRKLGSLSLYAAVAHAFGPMSRNVANLLATHAALALADAQRADQLRRALGNRDVIGQAKGILMATRRVSADDAFVLLTQTSQRLNRKLVDVSASVALSGELPDG